MVVRRERDGKQREAQRQSKGEWVRVSERGREREHKRKYERKAKWAWERGRSSRDCCVFFVLSSVFVSSVERLRIDGAERPCRKCLVVLSVIGIPSCSREVYQKNDVAE